jgi:hypothetical protein
MQTKIKFKKFIVEQVAHNPKTGKPQPTEVEVEAVDAFAALGKFLKRGVNGLGKGWTLTRQPNGWIVASNQNDKVLGRTYHRLKEVDWTRGGPQGL